jgi:hypothetical protein
MESASDLRSSRSAWRRLVSCACISVPRMPRSEQGELGNDDGRPGDATASGLVDLWDAKRHETAECVAEEKDGVTAGGGSLHRLGPLVGSGGGGDLCPCRQAAGTAPGEARRQSPLSRDRLRACAVSTYLDQVVKLGIDGETGRGTRR